MGTGHFGPWRDGGAPARPGEAISHLRRIRAAARAPRRHDSCSSPGMLVARLVDTKPKPLLRERALLQGTECLGDTELVALLLGTGAEGESAVSLAAQLLD